MKKIQVLITSFVFLFAATTTLHAQKDWSTVDFTKEYKGSVKIKGSAAKVLKSNKTFVSVYTINQAIVMKDSERSSILQSGSPKSVFAEASLVGIDQVAYQQLVDKLYGELVDGLKEAGLDVTDGNDAIQSKYVQKIAAKGKKHNIGLTGDNPSYENKSKITDGAILGYPAFGVKREVTFPPSNVNFFQQMQGFADLNYGLTTKEGFNLLLIDFNISFATFKGGKGYKKVTIKTNPEIAIKPIIKLYTPKGDCYISYDKDIYGSTGWAVDMEKTRDNKSDAEFFS